MHPSWTHSSQGTRTSILPLILCSLELQSGLSRLKHLDQQDPHQPLVSEVRNRSGLSRLEGLTCGKSGTPRGAASVSHSWEEVAVLYCRCMRYCCRPPRNFSCTGMGCRYAVVMVVLHCNWTSHCCTGQQAELPPGTAPVGPKRIVFPGLIDIPGRLYGGQSTLVYQPRCGFLQQA